MKILRHIQIWLHQLQSPPHTVDVNELLLSKSRIGRQNQNKTYSLFHILMKKKKHLIKCIPQLNHNKKLVVYTQHNNLIYSHYLIQFKTLPPMNFFRYSLLLFIFKHKRRKFFVYSSKTEMNVIQDPLPQHRVSKYY